MANTNTLGIIFSNMHDETINELTAKRTMGSIPYGGRYRLVDFALSNMVNSGIYDVGVVTKSNYQSLMDHVSSGREWDLARKRKGLNILPPFGNAGGGIYRGKLEALANTSSFIQHSNEDYVVMTDCDLVANIDYNELLEFHKANNADITVAYKVQEIMPETSQNKVILTMDEKDHRLTDVFIHPSYLGKANVLCNIFIISRILLLRIISEASSRNLYSFKQDILQKRCNVYRIFGYELKGYTSRIDSLQTYYDANMELLNLENGNQLFLKTRPIYTKVRDEVPAKYGLNAAVTNSLVADGCVIDGEVENSILFRNVYIEKGAKVKNSIIMQGTIIRKDSSLNCVITDKDVIVGEARELSGSPNYPIYIAKNIKV